MAAHVSNAVRTLQARRTRRQAAGGTSEHWSASTGCPRWDTSSWRQCQPMSCAICPPSRRSGSSSCRQAEIPAASQTEPCGAVDEGTRRRSRVQWTSDRSAADDVSPAHSNGRTWPVQRIFYRHIRRLRRARSTCTAHCVNAGACHGQTCRARTARVFEAVLAQMRRMEAVHAARPCLPQSAPLHTADPTLAGAGHRGPRTSVCRHLEAGRPHEAAGAHGCCAQVCSPFPASAQAGPCCVHRPYLRDDGTTRGP